MIAAIEGKVVKKEPTSVFLKCASGVTYKLSISLQCSSLINKDVIELYTTQVIREDANLLYGFISTDEQRMFEKLIKLSGIGPSTALAICSTLSPDAFSKALISSDANALIKVPGIGLKSAKRILVELGDFVLESSLDSSSQDRMDAALALEALGFKKEKVQAVLITCKSKTTQELIKEALSKLQ
ncbi:MAG: Holliday junction branch migration protein RuvA [Campylobacteraceae bacterium]